MSIVMETQTVNIRKHLRTREELYIAIETQTVKIKKHLLTREDYRDVERDDRNKVNHIHAVRDKPGDKGKVSRSRGKVISSILFSPTNSHFHFFGQTTSRATYSTEKKAMARL